MWIIDWLSARFSRLYLVLSYYYDKIIAAAKHAYNWAVNEAWKAYYRAKAWAYEKVEEAKVRLKLLILMAEILARSLYLQAKAYVLERVEVAKAVLRVARDVALGLLEDYVLSKISETWAFFRNPVDWIRKRIPLIDKIITWYDGFVDNPDSLFNRLQALFDTDAKFNIQTWYQNNAGRIINFFDNPLGFLMAFWQGYLLSFLEWSLAYALGTEKYELPAMPDWGRDGYGGEIIIGKPPPAGASGLVPPLSNIRVSGHPFRAGHPGIDLGLALSEPVFAMHDGKITIAGWSTVGYGFQVAIQGSDWWTRYAHFEVLNVKIGDRIKAGDTIGLGDSTGNSTGNHLHLEIKYKGSFIDPITVL